jgi:glycosyltransferase involved in cell wall biosynthesis
MTRKIRVVHIANNLHYGGMERVIAEITRRTDRSEFETHVLGLQFIGHFGEGLEEFATLHVADPMSRWSMLYPATLARQLERLAPDVVHMHSGVWYKSVKAAAIAGVPYRIFTDHGREDGEPWVNRMVDELASHRTHAVVCVSAELRDRVARIVRYPSRIHVIHNGVDTQLYSPRSDDGDFRREIGLDASTPIVGSVGRLEPVKGYHVMVEAFARLLKASPDSPRPALVLVGDGRERAGLESAAASLGISDAVHFMGWRSDIERISRAFTVFSMSSHSEGTSVSLLEAMGAGLCPVVTNVGGNAAVLGPMLQHRLVPPSDPDALAAALSHALGDRAAREQDAAIARARVVVDFNLDSMVRQYEALYRNARTGNPAEQ